MILYGRNPVREALRAGRRRVEAVWATERRRARAVARGRALRAIADAEEIARRCEQRPTTRASAPRPAPIRTSRRRELLGAPEPLIVALDEVQDPQNLGAIARTRRVRGRDRPRDPRAPHRRGHARGVQGVGGRRRAPARSRACATSPTSSAEAKAAGCWCYGAAPATGRATPSPTTAAASCSSWAPRAQGLRPRVARACDALVALPLHGRIESLNVSAAAAVLLYGILQRRRSA